MRRALACELERSDSSRIIACFVSIPIIESSLVHSSTLMEERDRVDKVLHGKYTDIKGVMDSSIPFCMFDSNGFHFSAEEPAHVDMIELTERSEGSGFFETIELGCCRSLSHNILKTRCLIGLVVFPISEFNRAEIVGKIVSILEK